MTFEEIVQNKIVRSDYKFEEKERDYNEYVTNEICFNCGSIMSFSYRHIPILDYGQTIQCRPLRLYQGKCVKCKEKHYALFYGEPDAVSVFFLPDSTMMLSDYSEYKSILSSQQYSDLQKATQSYKEGLFSGAFLYIRRILESLVFQVLEENKKIYKRTDSFKTLLDEAESFIPLFPDDLSDIKGSFYGFISEGIHVWTDDECALHYPLAEYAIKRILDHYKQKKEYEKKNAELRKAIGKMNNDKRS